MKDRRDVARLTRPIVHAGIADVLWLELAVGPTQGEGRLAGCGLVVVNPPFTLEDEMACLLPELQRQLGAQHGAWRIDRMGGRHG